MKTMKPNELRELGAEELAAKIRETRKQLTDMKLKLASKAEVEKPGSIRDLRRSVARMLTIEAQLKKEAK